MSNRLRRVVSIAVPAALAACLGVQPGEIAWPGSRVWEAAPIDAARAESHEPAAAPPGEGLAHEIELAQGRAALPERPVLAEAPSARSSARPDADDAPPPGAPALGPEESTPGGAAWDASGAGPAAEREGLRVVPEAALLPPGGASAVHAPHEYQLYFPLGSSDLDGPSMRVLHELIGNALLIRPSRVLVVGYADRSGPAELNQELSRRRALTVATHLRQAGVPRERIEIRALGEEELAVPTGDGAPEAGNRRVAVRLL